MRAEHIGGLLVIAVLCLTIVFAGISSWLESVDEDLRRIGWLIVFCTFSVVGALCGIILVLLGV